MFTLGNWIAVGVLFVLVMVIGLCIVEADLGDFRKGFLITLGIAIGLSAILLLIVGWYNTSTASGIRAVKDWKSELNNGINREITITAEDGREIFHYEGKVDIESNHEDNYIKFESEDGKRYIIYYGIQDTIQIIEK